MEYVYVMQAASGPCKVGYARDIRGRLSQLNVGSAEQISLQYWAKIKLNTQFERHQIDLAEYIETEVHKKLPRHMRGEWFDVSPEEAIEHVVKELKEAKKYFVKNRPEVGFDFIEYYEKPKKARAPKSPVEAIIIRLQPDLITRLDKASSEKGISRAALIRIICNEYLQLEEAKNSIVQ